jgi:hypothetical protein
VLALGQLDATGPYLFSLHGRGDGRHRGDYRPSHTDAPQ